MRLSRRLSFATPFVVVITACGGPKPETPRNPPPPKTSGLTSEQCKALVADSPCEADAFCSIDGDGCDLVGYHCRDGKWQAEQVACNPPPP